jgi:hypothetical protein
LGGIFSQDDRVRHAAPTEGGRYVLADELNKAGVEADEIIAEVDNVSAALGDDGATGAVGDDVEEFVGSGAGGQRA